MDSNLLALAIIVLMFVSFMAGMGVGIFIGKGEPK